MLDRSFQLGNVPRFMRPGQDMHGKDCVRVIRLDPEGVTLQIRMQTQFVSVWMPFAQAKDVAKAIQEAAS